MEADNKGKRTNSLAFAQTDCHTCALLGEQCDRRRPQCSTCLALSRKCGGFATPLSWDPRRMWMDNPSIATERPGNDCASSITATAEPAFPRRFRFVSAGSRLRKRRKGRTRTADPKQAQLPDQSGEAVAITPTEIFPRLVGEDQGIRSQDQTANGLQLTGGDNVGDDIWDEFGLFDSLVPNTFESAPFPDIGLDPFAIDSPRLTVLPRTPPVSDHTTRASEFMPESLDHDPVLQEFETMPSDPTVQGDDFDVPGAASNLLVQPASFGLSPHDHDRLLELYDSEFCVLPLTSDISINPFRCQHQTSRGSRLVFHSILALCCQHLKCLTGSWSAEADEHRRKALQLLDSALQAQQIQNSFHLLDPILILFTLDCTLSAAGSWTAHLTRAHSLLQACGGPSALITPRVRSQVGMLLWWDATLALISRKGPTMDRAYLEFLVRWEQQDEWSFFDLTGCPRELFVHLFDLAGLAHQFEISLSMKWLSFSTVPIVEIESRLVQWKNDDRDVAFAGDGADQEEDEEYRPGISRVETEEQLHAQQDRFHCAETWRCALLLYLERVFKGDRGRDSRAHTRRHLALNRLARKIINHSQCCRRTSQTQKQLLLPIFLAGCETADAEMREFVKGYCTYWGERSRYNMFNSASVLLEEIWSTQQWWGAVIDSKSRSSSTEAELLFG
ncbi:hypothetical protein ASPVEDRAFT_82811 [Aspergillus versicolor CBS 583.65]|uniref:Zn(2)-C6 fungal-type domain-containing protein n=1 Tax=Aspergillus versicolor CBS 583.65 TaxID=1036611 RepID=A0A1L9PIC3_ASPVE|nr:uncharacterized protein ASPVEDRAFT_82811 [Aspergillus versicolor CBS 583.65]OJJ01287.1 hypothetical protein ASPVEDRAFT_82811 [Aspergillus versicolor CBS 583.65]